MTVTTRIHPSETAVLAWLAEIEDPEIPVLSIVDLGIVRNVRWNLAGHEPECVVTVTPTYSGCPAVEVISQSILQVLAERGVSQARIETQISPAWTTDWLGDEARRKLKDYGIAPPPVVAIPVNAIGRGPRAPAPPVACPRCGSDRTELTCQFGSTPCKALHRCLSCLEPFDLFKCH